MNQLLNKIINGNNLNILKDIPDGSIDLIVTDPPYGINYKSWDQFSNFLEFSDSWIKECVRILKQSGTIWSFMGYENIIDFIFLLNNYGNIHLENWVIWARQKGRGSSKHLKSSREDILHFTKSDIFTWNPLKMLREVVTPYVKNGEPRGWFLDENGKRVRWTGLGNVWVYTAPFWKSKNDKQLHPAQKPIKLIERLILLSSNENDIVLDPFNGSGTTCLAAKMTNRNFIGIDISKEYCEIAERRLEEYESNNSWEQID